MGSILKVINMGNDINGHSHFHNYNLQAYQNGKPFILLHLTCFVLIHGYCRGKTSLSDPMCKSYLLDEKIICTIILGNAWLERNTSIDFKVSNKIFLIF